MQAKVTEEGTKGEELREKADISQRIRQFRHAQMSLCTAMEHLHLYVAALSALPATIQRKTLANLCAKGSSCKTNPGNCFASSLRQFQCL